jgi:hypothetical protein
MQHKTLLENPKYEALSYTWGDETPTETIYLHGHEFQAFENTAVALRRLRSKSTESTLWIDAVCINQMDLQEREEQVSLIDKIYKHAEQVIIWLGEHRESGNVPMKSLATHTSSLSNNVGMWRAQKNSQVQRGWGRMSTAVKMGEAERAQLDGEIGEVAELLDRLWWRRVWIVQEIVLAKKSIVMCRSDQVPWEVVAKRLREHGIYDLQSLKELRSLSMVNGVIVEESLKFPDDEHRLLDKLRSAW